MQVEPASESRSENLIAGARLLAAAALLAALGVGAAAGPGRDAGPGLPLAAYLLYGLLLVLLLPLALLLGAASAGQKRLGREMAQIAAWPPGPPPGPRDMDALLAHLLDHAGLVLQAPRLLLAWEEVDEPWLHLADWSRRAPREVETSREAPPAFQPPVAEPLAEASFLAADLGGSAPTVWRASAGGLERWSGAPVHEDLRRRLGADRLASWPVRGEAVAGRLFALDRWSLDRDFLDFLTLGEVVARRVATELDRYYLAQQLRSTAVVEERIRVACDLHDGMLQSLTSNALQLEVLARQLEGAPEEAREQLAEIQRSIAADQKELRFFIEELKPAAPRGGPGEADLTARLADLAARLKRQCGLAVEFDLEGVRDGIPQGLARQLYRLLREALFNVARHSGAARAQVEVRQEGRGLTVEVTDDGRGFPFQGHYEHEELNRQKLGPVSLKERLSALGGSLAIDSGPGRTRLAMRLPVAGGGR